MSYKPHSSEKEDPLLKRKPPLKHERKPLIKNPNRQIRFLPKEPSAQFLSQMRPTKNRIKENESILQANVSLIEGSSFISNKHDHSLDSMDKMIIGVGADEKESEKDDSKISGGPFDIDFTQIHKQYEQLIGRNHLLGQDEDSQNLENSQVLFDEEWQPQKEADSKLSQTTSPRKKNQEIKKRLEKIEHKMQEIKSSALRKYQDVSTSSIKNLNMGNLSAIHEEHENYHPNNDGRHDNIRITHEEDEEDLIDFVSHPSPENQKKHELEEEVAEDEEEWDDQSPMLANLDLQLEKETNNNKAEGKQREKNRNYQQLLTELDSKEDEGDLSEQAVAAVEAVLNKRQRWIRSCRAKGEAWIAKQLGLLQTMRAIIKNPFLDESKEAIQY